MIWDDSYWIPGLNQFASHTYFKVVVPLDRVQWDKEVWGQAHRNPSSPPLRLPCQPYGMNVSKKRSFTHVYNAIPGLYRVEKVIFKLRRPSPSLSNAVRGKGERERERWKTLSMYRSLCFPLNFERPAIKSVSSFMQKFMHTNLMYANSWTQWLPRHGKRRWLSSILLSVETWKCKIGMYEIIVF